MNAVDPKRIEAKKNTAAKKGRGGKAAKKAKKGKGGGGGKG